jgi:hypothetical protein
MNRIVDQRLAPFACPIPQITRDARVRRGISCHEQRHRLERGKPGQVAHAHLEGIVSKRKAAPYRSGECRDWHKTKTAAWRTANPDPKPRCWTQELELRGPRARRSSAR